jgi:DNA segregation ATPase FtsK/SpoIIIE-like protein
LNGNKILKHYDKYHKELDELIKCQLTLREEVAYKHALSFVHEVKMVSISKIQRALRIGYNHSERIIERMGREGFVSKPKPDGSRKLLIDLSQKTTEG